MLELPSFTFPEFEIPLYAIRVLKGALGFIGFVFLLQILWAAWLVFTSHGYEAAHKKAVASRKSAVIGLLFVIGANSLANYAVQKISEVGGLALK